MRRIQGSSRDRATLVSPLESSDLGSLTTGSSSRQRSSAGRGEKERHARVSRARSAAALNRVQEVEERNSQLQRFKESAREKTAELERCKEEMGQKDLQIRDLQYELAKMKRERGAHEEQRKETDARNRANILALRNGLESLEQSVKDKHAYLTQETKQMLEMVEALLRHTMNGFHAGPTRTTSDLLQTLQSRLSTMHETLKVDQMSDQVHARTHTRHRSHGHVSAEEQQPERLKQRSASSASMKNRPPSSSQSRHGAAATASEKPAEMGRSVSAEAGISAQRVSKQGSMNAIKNDPAMAKLINQYRSVIVKEREQSTSLKAQLAQEKSTTESLRHELEELRADLREVFHDRKIDHGRLIAAEADKAKLVMMFEGMVGTEEVERRKHALRQRHKKPHRRRSREPTLATQDDESSYGAGVTSEEAAEQDIRMLDDQIGRLKLQLERAALDHTNEIMSKVVQCAGSNQQHISTSP